MATPDIPRIEEEIKRLPNGQFPPGVSGNPEGRPKGSISIKTLLVQRLQEVPLGQVKDWASQLVEVILHQAIVNKDPQIIKLIVNYMDGLPVQPLANPDGTPLTIQFAEVFKQKEVGEVPPPAELVIIPAAPINVATTDKKHDAQSPQPTGESPRQ